MQYFDLDIILKYFGLRKIWYIYNFHSPHQQISSESNEDRLESPKVVTPFYAGAPEFLLHSFLRPFFAHSTFTKTNLRNFYCIFSDRRCGDIYTDKFYR